MSVGSSCSERGFSLLELLVAAFCTVLLAGAVMPLVVGSAQAVRLRTDAIGAQLLADLVLQAVATDLRGAGGGLEGARSIQLQGVAIPFVGSTADGGLQLVRTIGPAKEVEEVAGSGTFRVDSPDGLRAGVTVVAIGLPDQPPGAPAPAGTITAVLQAAEGAHVTVGWGELEAASVAAWGPPRALVPVAVREYRLRPFGDGLQLRRRDAGGSWQPVAESLRGLAFAYRLDRDGDGLPEGPAVSTAPPGSTIIHSVRIEIEVQRSSQRATARAWTRLRPRLDAVQQ